MKTSVKGKNFLLWEFGKQILSFKSNPQFLSDTGSTIKVKNFFFFFYQLVVWKTVKCQGKMREKSGDFEMDDKWQPCSVKTQDRN